MFAEHAGTHQSETARKQELPGGVAEGVLGIGQRRRASLQQHRRDDQTGQRPADGTEALHEITAGHAHAATVLVMPRAHARQYVRLGYNADQPVDGKHHDSEQADVARRDHRKHFGRQGLPNAREAPNGRQPQRNQHEREKDDQKALDEVGVGHGEQAAEEAIDKEAAGHQQDDRVRLHRGACGYAHQFAGSLEHGAEIKHKIG